MVDTAEYSFRSCGFLCHTRVGQHGGGEIVLITDTVSNYMLYPRHIYSPDICEDCD